MQFVNRSVTLCCLLQKVTVSCQSVTPLTTAAMQYQTGWGRNDEASCLAKYRLSL
jgi:hypothetical protein